MSNGKDSFGRGAAQDAPAILRCAERVFLFTFTKYNH